MKARPLTVPHEDFYIENLKRTTEYNMYNYHLHQEFEIYYLVSGERKYFIDDNVYTVQAGNLVLIDANEIHKTGSIGGQHHERTVIYFNYSFLKELYPHISNLNLLSCFQSEYRVLPLSLKYKHTTEDILNKMISISDFKNHLLEPRKRFYIQLLLCELLVLINNFIDKLEEKEYYYSQLMHPKITQIIKYINGNYNKSITLSDMSEKFYISPSYLSKLFKDTTNFTFTEYLNSVRIKNAKILLTKPNYRIIDVAQKVGFNNNTHFTRVFKDITGMSPTNYKKLLKT